MSLEDDLHIGSIDGEPVVSLFDTTFMQGTGGAAAYDTEAHFDEIWSIIDPWYVGRSREGGVIARDLGDGGDGGTNDRVLPPPLGDVDPAEISAWLPTPGRPTSVVIHDLSGRRMRTLSENAILGPGEQFLTWDGHDQQGHAVTPGIYFCTVRAADDRATVKLIHRR
mgnify:CR=1 FL=1